MRYIVLLIAFILCQENSYSLDIKYGIKYSSRDCINCYLGLNQIFKTNPDIPIYCSDYEKYNLNKFLIETYGEDRKYNINVLSNNNLLDSISFTSFFIADFDSKKIIALREIREVNNDDLKTIEIFSGQAIFKVSKKGKFKLPKSIYLTPDNALIAGDKIILCSNKGRLWFFSLKNLEYINYLNWGNEYGLTMLYDNILGPNFYSNSKNVYGDTFTETVNTLFRFSSFQYVNNNLFFIVTLPYLKDDSHFAEISALCELSLINKYESLVFYKLPSDYENKLNYYRTIINEKNEIIVPHYDDSLNDKFIYYKGIVNDSIEINTPYFPIMFERDSLVLKNRYTYITNSIYNQEFIATPFFAIIQSISKYRDYSFIKSSLNISPPLKKNPIQFNGMSFDDNSFSVFKIKLDEIFIKSYFYLNGFLYEIVFDKINLKPTSLRVYGPDYRNQNSFLLFISENERMLIDKEKWEYRIEKLLNN